MHSQKMREKLLNPWVIATKDGKVLSSHCDCMAGLGEVCTHIAALLFAVDGTVQIRDSRTVTQEPAYWLLPKSVKGVSYNETGLVNFTAAKTMKRRFDQSVDSAATSVTPPPSAKKQKKKTPAPSQDDLSQLFCNMNSSGRRTSILSIIPGFAKQYVPKSASVSFPQTLTQLKDREAMTLNYKDLLDKCEDISLKVTEEEVKNVEFATRKQSAEKLWYDFRAGRLTASKMKSICHTDETNPSQSLIKAICYPSSTKFSNAATKWGIANETVARSQLLTALGDENHDNLQIQESGLHISCEIPFIAASPDGIVSCDCCGRVCIEVKCPYKMKDQMINEDCGFLHRSDQTGELQLNRNHQYFYQVQTQMGVTKTELCYFVVWTNNDVHIEQIEFDSGFYEEICVKASQFFKVSVLPELVGKFYTRLPGSGLPVTETSNCATVSNHIDSISPLSCLGEKVVQSSATDTVEKWCYCQEEESGEMVCCDNENCVIGWFHFTCLKLTVKPKTKKWYCPDCRKLPQFSRKKK